jgi:hypothetical protein
MLLLSVWCLSFASSVLAGPQSAGAGRGSAEAATPFVTEVANLRFHSDPLINLHHTLYAAAWAQRPEAGTRAAHAGRLPAPDAPLNDDERKIWTAAISHYHTHLAGHALLSQQSLDASTAREHGDLWHVVQFYVAGAVVKDVLRVRGIDYVPYLYATGLFDRAWPHYRQRSRPTGSGTSPAR